MVPDGRWDDKFVRNRQIGFILLKNLQNLRICHVLM